MTTEANRIEYKQNLNDSFEKEVVAFLNSNEFFLGYSKPTSRELMRIYKDLELVEHLGSGLGRILNAYGKDSFKISQNFMRNIFYKNENSLNEGVNEGVKSLYDLIKNKPNNRSTYFASELNTSVKNIERWLKQLKDEDKIEFKGAPKTGGYSIKKMGTSSQ